MTPEAIGLLAFWIVVLSILPYAWEILRGRASTSVTGWLISTLTGIVTYVTYGGIGADSNRWIGAVEIADPLLVVLAAFFAKNAWGRLEKGDQYALLFGCAALLVHVVAHSLSSSGWIAEVAYWSAVLADTFGAWHIVKFAWKNPHEEQPAPWGLSIVGIGLSFFSITTFTVAQISLPLYQLAFCSLVFIPALRYRLRARRV